MTYLYYPRCKIAKADQVLDGTKVRATFYIKSLTNSPKHFPAHGLVKGKPEFFFVWQDNSLSTEIIIQNRFISLFGAESIKNGNRFIISHIEKKEVSVIAYFDPMLEVKLDCFGIGAASQLPVLFNNQQTDEYNAAICRVAKLDSELSHKKIKTKVNKV